MSDRFRGLVAVAFLCCASCGHPDGVQSDAPTLPTNVPIVTTVQAIAAGEFRSGVDKEGDGGTLVRVGNLRVLKVVPNDDGDWHLVVTDGRMPAFITEIIPRDQKAGVVMPRDGAVIEETGTPYFDVESNVPDHQYTPWEIHPVTSWVVDPHTTTTSEP